MREPVTCILNFFPGPNTIIITIILTGDNFISSTLHLLISHITAIYFNSSIFFPRIFLFISDHERMDMYVQSGHLKYVRK